MAKVALVEVLISRKVGSFWHRIAIGRYYPTVGTSFAFQGTREVHEQIENAVTWLVGEPGADTLANGQRTNWLDIDGVDGEQYRVGPVL